MIWFVVIGLGYMCGPQLPSEARPLWVMPFAEQGYPPARKLILNIGTHLYDLPAMTISVSQHKHVQQAMLLV